MKSAEFVFAASVCLTLSACSNQYIERKDSVTVGLGDAVASNIAVMTPDPWPPRSKNNSIPMDGVKAATALARYRAAAAPGGGGPAIGAPIAPPPAQ